MSLHRKTFLIVSLTLTALLVILYFSAQTIIIQNFEEVERQITRRNVQRVAKTLQEEVENLNRLAYDWAAWDDTYQFVHDHNPEYVASNLVDQTFTGSRLNFLLILDENLSLVAGKAYDLIDSTEIPLDESLLQTLLVRNPVLLDHSNPQSSVAGFVSNNNTPLMVASRPIITSEDEGPIRGTLMLGRVLTEPVIDRFSAETLTTLSIYPVDDVLIPDDFRQAKQALLNDRTAIFVHPLYGVALGGYILLEDIQGNPSLILRVDSLRTIYQQTRQAIRYFLWSLAVVIVTFLIAIYVILEKFVLSRLLNLTQQVTQIGTRQDLSARIHMSGGDELQALADSINRMLADLESADHALRSSEEKYKTLMETLPDIVYRVDCDHRITFINRAVEQLGFSPAQLIGQPITTLIHPQDASKLVTDSPAQSEEASRHVEIRLLTEEASRETHVDALESNQKYGEVITRPLYDPNISPGNKPQPIGTIGIIRDITERKRIEERLRLRNFVYESINEAVIISDLNGVTVDLNPATERLYGWSRAEMLNRTCEFLNPPDQAADITRRIFEGLNREGVWEGELPVITKSGQHRITYSVISRLYDNNGNWIGNIGLNRDVTEQKQAQEALKSFAAELEKKVAERTRELNEALKKEKELSQLKTRFVSLASHEFRTPLTAISAANDVLEEYADQMDAAKKTKYFNRIRKSVNYITRLLEQVLLVGRAEAGKLEFKPKRIDLAELGESLVHEFQLTQGKNHHLHYEATGELSQAYVDENLMHHIIANLLSNAIKYSESGTSIYLTLAREGEDVRLSVTDEGIGIPEADQEKLFESFYRGENVGTISGTGLGLTIIQQGVELHQGTITLTSKEHEGTTFTIRFPYQPTENHATNGDNR
ncbi:MAG: PAS domain S-box protein [Gemmatimonadetes bacterium]|nr:MAG: PAS domain S-box protein [Gemmatimonadota bacterium]